MTTQTQPEQIDAAEVWRAIGRLEGDTAALKEGQRALAEGQRGLREEIREVREWVVRLFYAVLAAIVVALIVALIAAFQR